MPNPKTPVEASFPIPPPHARLAITDASGAPTQYFFELVHAIWAAIQGTGGILDLELLSLFGQPSVSAAEVEALRKRVATLEAIILGR